MLSSLKLENSLVYSHPYKIYDVHQFSATCMVAFILKEGSMTSISTRCPLPCHLSFIPVFCPVFLYLSVIWVSCLSEYDSQANVNPPIYPLLPEWRIQFSSPVRFLGGPGILRSTSLASEDFLTMTSFSRSAVCIRRTLNWFLREEKVKAQTKHLAELKHVEEHSVMKRLSRWRMLIHTHWSIFICSWGRVDRYEIWMD